MNFPVVFATRNLHKLNEVKDFMPEINLYSLKDYPDISSPVEDGRTFLENAVIKAESIYKQLRVPVIADDSGLEVYELNNRPGIFSKRYAGENATDEERIKKLLDELKDIPFEKRKARFVCVAVLKISNKLYSVTGICEGYISFTPRGNNGFGYDPVFYLPDIGKTMAELSRQEKGCLSHRGNAFKKLYEIIKGIG